MVDLQVIKSANTSYVFLKSSNKLLYSILIINNGDSRATGVKVKDIIDCNGKLIAGSVNVDGCNNNVLLSDMSISVGVIEPGGSSVVTYEVEVSKKSINKTISNKALVSYSDLCCGSCCNKFVVESNLLTIPVINVDVKVKKLVDKSCARVGEVLSYTLLIRNDSNISIQNVILNDYLQKDLQLFPGSIVVNGIPDNIANLEDIDLGTINAYSTLIIQFKAKVLSIPICSSVKNLASLNFEYKVLDNYVEIVANGTSCSNEVFTRILEKNYICDKNCK